MTTTINGSDVHKLVVACDAGMGSSVMLAGQLRKQLKAYSVQVEHTPVSAIPADADVVVCHAGLAERARASAPGKLVIPFQVFIGDPAVRRCGEVLVGTGAVDPAYVEAMLERERSISTYVGEGVAIPHGTLASKDAVRRDALSFVRFPETVDWGGEQVTICIGIAAQGDGHIGILAALAEILLEPGRAEALRAADDPNEVLRLLQPAREDTST